MGERAILIIDFGLMMLQTWLVSCVLLGGKVKRWWGCFVLYGIFVGAVCVGMIDLALMAAIALPMATAVFIAVSVQTTLGKGIWWKCGCLVVVFYINEICAEIYGVIFFLNGGETLSSEQNMWGMEFVSSMVSLAVIIVLCFIGRKVQSVINSSFSYKKYIQNGMMIAVIFVTMCLVYVVITLEMEASLEKNANEYLKFSSLSIIVLLGISVLIGFVWYIRNNNDRLEQLVKTERHLRRMQENYYEMMLEREKTTKQYRHDMNNLLIGLMAVAEQDGPQTFTYVKGLNEKIQKPYEHTYYTGNSILDTVLGYYMQQLPKNVSVKVIGKCQRKVFVSDIDMCTIFSNLIQNAVEEIQRLERENAFFKLEIKQGKQCLCITLSNSCRTEEARGTPFLKTSKEDVAHHGIGLCNVLETVKKNGGEISFECQEDIFTCIVTFH